MATGRLDAALDAIADEPDKAPDYAGHGFVGVQAETMAWIIQQSDVLDRLRMELAVLAPKTAAYHAKIAEINRVGATIRAACDKIAFFASPAFQVH